MRRALNLEHVKAVGNSRKLKISLDSVICGGKTAGNMSSLLGGGAALEDAKSDVSVNISHGSVSVSGNHAVRVEGDRLHVLASRLPRMQPPAGASHVVFKSLKHGLACLLLPDDTWTNCDGGGGKFRAEKLYVVAVWSFHGNSPAELDASNYDRSYRYVAGELGSTKTRRSSAAPVCTSS